MGEVIRLEGVVKAAGDGSLLVGGIDLVVGEREHVRITGPAGGMRTALLRLIAGMDKPDFGRVCVLGTPLHELDADAAAALRNRAMGICLNDPALLADLPAWENAALPLAARGVPARERRRAALERLEALGIAYCAQALPSRLSAYEARLVSIARALVASPQVLLLDDVTAGLPERRAAELEALLAAQSGFAGAAALLFTSADSGLPADRRLIMEHGTLTEVPS